MILVLGATGKVGKEVAKQLVERGQPVRILVRDRKRAEAVLDADGYDVVEGGFDDPEALARSMEGIESVFIVTLDEESFYTHQLEKIIGAAQTARVARAVMLSARADVTSYMPFFRWHGIAERMLLNSGIPCTLLRPAWFMQNFLTTAAGGVLSVSAGEGLMGFIDTRDIASAAVAALTEPGHQPKLYLLTGPEALSHYQVAEILSECTGKKFTYNAIDEDAYRAQLIADGGDEEFVNLSIDISEDMRKRRSGKLWPDLEEILGHKGHSFRQFALDHVETFRKLAP